MKTIYYQDKVSLVTGGSSGIGLALAKALVERGSRVCILARNPERLNGACEELTAAIPAPCCMIPADVSDANQVEAAIQKVIAEHGQIDLIFNSAGVVYPGFLVDQPLNVFHETMDIDFFGAVNIVKAALPGMLALGKGHIVNIGSSASFLGFFGYSSYASAKFALRGFSDSLRHELKSKGIKVSIVFPADTDTPQLKYDKEHRPLELAAFMNLLSGSMPPEKVAVEILRGVEKGRYIILPGFDSKLVFWVVSLLGTKIYPVIDFLAAYAIKRAKLNTKEPDRI